MMKYDQYVWYKAQKPGWKQNEKVVKFLLVDGFYDIVQFLLIDMLLPTIQ